MRKNVKQVLLMMGILVFFTSQARCDDQKNKQQGVGARPGGGVVHHENAPQVHTQTQEHHVTQQPPRQQQRVAQAPAQHQQAPQERRKTQPWQGGPHVVAVQQAPPSENNSLFHRQHHNNWQPRYNFYNNGYHFYPYVNIASLVELTNTGITVSYEGQNYFYDDGNFYVQDDTGQYVAVAPPVGIIVPAIPATAHQLDLNGETFWRSKGVFYVQVAGGYQVIAPLEGATEDS